MKENDFIKINQEKLLEGILTITRNAIRHYNVSVALIKNEDCKGICVSHLILFLEEASKAFVLHKTLTDGNPEKKFAKLFSDHSIKHRSLNHSFSQMHESLDILLSYIIRLIENNPIQTNDNKNDNSLDEYKRIKIESESFFKENQKEIIKFLKKANKYRTTGLYVDYVENKWTNPNDLSIDNLKLISQYCYYQLILLQILTNPNLGFLYKKDEVVRIE